MCETASMLLDRAAALGYINPNKIRLVRVKGLEPPRLAAPEPKLCADVGKSTAWPFGLDGQAMNEAGICETQEERRSHAFSATYAGNPASARPMNINDLHGQMETEGGKHAISS